MTPRTQSIILIVLLGVLAAVAFNVYRARYADDGDAPPPVSVNTNSLRLVWTIPRCAWTFCNASSLWNTRAFTAAFLARRCHRPPRPLARRNLLFPLRQRRLRRRPFPWMQNILATSAIMAEVTKGRFLPRPITTTSLLPAKGTRSWGGSELFA